MQRKLLPLPPKNNQQVKEYTSAVKRGLKGYYVIPSGKGWIVRKADTSSASGSFNTKAAAVAYAKKSAGSQADVVLQSTDGKVALLALSRAEVDLQGT